MTAPALTSRIWGILFRNEWFKARKRLAFLLPVGFYVFMASGNYGTNWYEARNDPERSFTLPEVWSSVFDDDMSIFFLLFGSVCLIMLISSEFSWRTARQNVIDGASKSQWFVGKSMLVPMLGVLFIGVNLLLASIFGFMGTDMAAASGPVFPFSVLKAAGGIFLAFLSIGGLALFISLAVRGSGGAMAVWFLWIFPMEQLIIPMTLGRIDALADYLQYQPFAVAQRLIGFENYDPAAFDRMVERITEAGEGRIPPTPDLTTVLWVNAGWAVFFLVAAFLMFRKRDL